MEQKKTNLEKIIEDVKGNDGTILIPIGEGYEATLQNISIDLLRWLNQEYVPPKPKTVYELKKDDKYYFIDSYNDVKWCTWEDLCIDLARRSIGNVFLAKEEAEFELERRKVYAIVKKYAHDFTEEEWKYDGITKFYPYYCYEDNAIEISSAYSSKRHLVYFKSKDDIQKAVKEVGEERFKKYYLGVKE